MKYRFSLLFALMAILMTSCIKDNSEDTLFGSAEDGAYPFVTDVVNGFFDLTDLSSNAGFTVNTSTSGDVAVSSIDIMKSFNGGAEVKHSTISGTSGTIAGSVADVADGLGVDVNNLALGDEFKFTFVLNTSDGRALNSPVSVEIPMSCVSDLAGTYSATATYGFHDFLADLPTSTATVELVKVNEGIYSIADLSAGLYAETGPYGTAYGTTGLAMEFRDVCNNISWTDQADPWGPCIPQDAPAVNSVDPVTGVITISWFCEGYGENGVTVLTPQ